jgi:hypothetical protein
MLYMFSFMHMTLCIGCQQPKNLQVSYTMQEEREELPSIRLHCEHRLSQNNLESDSRL